MIHLSVKKRDTKVKAKNVLKEQLIPGVIYGPKHESLPVSVERTRFLKVYRKAGETTLIALDMEGEDKEKEDNVVLIRDTQSHPVTGRFVHVDFYQLPMDQEIEITVPIESIGEEPPAVKEQGGVLVHNLHEVDIKALPKDLIHEIKVDLSFLENIGDSVLLKDLSVPDSVELLADPEETVFIVEEPREEEEPEEEVETTEDDQIAEIKTEGEEKREKEEAEEEEEKALEEE